MHLSSNAPKKQKRNPTPTPIRSPPLDCFDHYLGKIVQFFFHGRFPLSQACCDLLLPRELVCMALCIHAQRSLQPPPPLPSYMQLRFRPLQLQRFLRGFVFAASHALVTPPASVLVHARTKSRYIERIFVRVMSGFVARAEVRR